jgi:hypothetical protein
LAQLGVRETTGFVTVELGKEFGHVSLMSTRYEPEHRAHELYLPEGIRRISEGIQVPSAAIREGIQVPSAAIREGIQVPSAAIRRHSIRGNQAPLNEGAISAISA